MVDRMMHVRVDNDAGECILVCNPEANKEAPIQTCLAPEPQQDYLLFRENTKWLVKGAKETLSLEFMRDFSVTYSKGENIGLLPAKSSEAQGFRIYWLLSWTAKRSVLKR
jgi:hypothetical protein